MRALSPLRRDSGFTLVELMIAIFVLLVGVLGTVSLVDGANRTSSGTRAREGANNLARDIIEDAHALPITQAAAVGENLQSDIQNLGGPGDADGSKAGWQVNARGFTYTVTISVCGVDDIADGLGTQDSSFNWCSAHSNSTADTNALDYARIAVAVSWTDRGGTHQVKQGGVLNNLSNGPLIKSLDTVPSTGGRPVITDQNTTVINFAALTDEKAASAEWFLNGTDQGPASSSDGKNWTWSWNLKTATGGSPCSSTLGGVLDGTYLVGIQAFDTSGLSAGQKAATVSLNRCPPLTPTGLIGGWDVLFPTDIEINWDGNPEGDIVGYYVYRQIGASGGLSPVLVGKCSGLLRSSQCTDDDPAATGSSSDISYQVYAVDRDPTGVLRKSPTASTTVLARWQNQAANPPVSVAPGGATSTLTWTRPATQDPDAGDIIDYYRVYRVPAGTLASSVKISDRYDTVDNTGASASYTDPSPLGAGTATYYVTSVDNHGGESPLTPATGVTP